MVANLITIVEKIAHKNISNSDNKVGIDDHHSFLQKAQEPEDEIAATELGFLLL